MTEAIRKGGNPAWVKGGASPNPKGRPKTGLALAETIRGRLERSDARALTDLVELALDVAMGRPVIIDTDWIRAAAEARARGEPEPPRKGEAIQPTMAEMQRAWDWLAQWGYRKPPTDVEVTDSSGETKVFDYDRLSDAELAELERMQRKAAGIVDVRSVEVARALGKTG